MIYFVGALAVIIIGGAIWIQHRLGPAAKKRVIDILEQRFNANVDIKTLQIKLLPHAQVIGEQLAIRREGSEPGHPFIGIKRFVAGTNWLSLLGPWNTVDVVRLEGLEIHIDRANKKAKFSKPKKRVRFPLVIQQIHADGTLLEIEPKEEGKDPLDWEIKKLHLTSVGIGKPMKFKATLTNAKPPGLIESTGTFGPWQTDEIRGTPVSGDYTFDQADLGVFKGIRGILSSKGKYGGVLEKIDVRGTTETPDFAITAAANPMMLKTTFHAIVNGTNGNTYLEPVDASFLNSLVHCVGSVEGKPGRKGKTVTLQVNTLRARIEDMLTLAMKGEPVLRGDVGFSTNFVLPPGKIDVIEKLMLDGEFGLKSAEFANEKIDEKIGTLSKRSRGINAAEQERQATGATTYTDLTGKFKLNKAVLALNGVRFSIPGASLNLTGTYNLQSETIDFEGKARTEAKPSEMTTGFKSLLLKAVDPFVSKKDAGTVVPLKLSGTRSKPAIGIGIFKKTLGKTDKSKDEKKK